MHGDLSRDSANMMMCINKTRREDLVCTINDFRIGGHLDVRLDLSNDSILDQEVSFKRSHLIITAMTQDYPTAEENSGHSRKKR